MDTTNNKYTSEFNELLNLHGLTNSVSEPAREGTTKERVYIYIYIYIALKT